MSYNFKNLDDRALDELEDAVREERRRRFLDKHDHIAVYLTGKKFDDIKALAQEHNLPLLQAKWLVDYNYQLLDTIPF